jgi:hypothetical protein
MDYMLKRWPAFTRFLGDGRICLTNNAAERALRGIALGCKAWLFAGSDRGGERAAAMYVQVDDRPASETLHESRRSVVAAAASEFEKQSELSEKNRNANGCSRRLPDVNRAIGECSELPRTGHLVRTRDTCTRQLSIPANLR